MKNTRTSRSLLAGALTLGLLAIPSTLAQGTGVTGITLQALPNAVTVSWQAPASVVVSHYNVYYARQSILGNNGRFDEKEGTLGPETSLVLLDLPNRGFGNADTIYVTVTVVNDQGSENLTFAEEKSTQVIIPTSTPVAMGTTGLENAVAENLTNIRLHFSLPVVLPAPNAALQFAIREELTGNPVGILAAEVLGQDVQLTTLPMATRGRYTVSVSDAVTAADGTPLDPARRSATFIARGEDIPLPPTPPPLLEVPQPDTTPPEPPSALVLRKVLQKDGNYTVHASWQESLNTAADLASYNLYESGDRGVTFVGPMALRATVTSTTIANVPPGTLTVKMTAMDKVGNESAGIQEMIVLPETGPAVILALSALGAGAWTTCRKRKSKN